MEKMYYASKLADVSVKDRYLDEAFHLEVKNLLLLIRTDFLPDFVRQPDLLRDWMTMAV